MCFEFSCQTMSNCLVLSRGLWFCLVVSRGLEFCLLTLHCFGDRSKLFILLSWEVTLTLSWILSLEKSKIQFNQFIVQINYANDHICSVTNLEFFTKLEKVSSKKFFVNFHDTFQFRYLVSFLFSNGHISFPDIPTCQSHLLKLSPLFFVYPLPWYLVVE